VRDLLSRLRQEAFAKAIFVVDEDGELLVADAQEDDALAALGHDATEQMDNLGGFRSQMKPPEWGLLLKDAVGDDVYVVELGAARRLGVVFGGGSSLGLVRLRVKALYQDLSDAAAAL
jgi:hypothetical protein